MELYIFIKVAETEVLFPCCQRKHTVLKLRKLKHNNYKTHSNKNRMPIFLTKDWHSYIYKK